LLNKFNEVVLVLTQLGAIAIRD